MYGHAMTTALRMVNDGVGVHEAAERCGVSRQALAIAAKACTARLKRKAQRVLMMTNNEFDRAASMTSMSEEALDRARHVLVFGMTHAEVAESAGVSRACVTKQVQRVERAFMELSRAPSEHVCVTVVVPRGSETTVKAAARKLRKDC